MKTHVVSSGCRYVSVSSLQCQTSIHRLNWSDRKIRNKLISPTRIPHILPVNSNSKPSAPIANPVRPRNHTRRLRRTILLSIVYLLTAKTHIVLQKVSMISLTTATAARVAFYFPRTITTTAAYSSMTVTSCARDGTASMASGALLHEVPPSESSL